MEKRGVFDLVNPDIFPFFSGFQEMEPGKLHSPAV